MTTQESQSNLPQEVTQASPFLSDKQIAKYYGVTRVTVWRWAANDPTFPKPIKLSPGCTRWKLSDLEAWECSKTAANQSAEV